VTYEVELSEQAKALLERLHREDRRSCHELALLLLRLEKDPRPDGSRELAVEARPSGKRSVEERVWRVANFQIVYRVNRGRRAIEVGIVSTGRA